MKNKILIAFLCLIFLSGCGFFNSAPLEVITKAEEKVPLNIPELASIKLTKLRWIILTPENYEEVFNQLQTEGVDTVVFALTDHGYEELAVNLATIKQFMIEQGAILKAYKAYYEPKIYYAPEPVVPEKEEKEE